MDAKTYQIEASRTAAPIDAVASTCEVAAQNQIRLLLSVIGISGEVGEVLEVILNQPHPEYSFDIMKFTKELGDVYWYNAHARDSVGDSLENVFPEHDEILAKAKTLQTSHRAYTAQEIVPVLVVEASKLSEFTKKVVFHRHNFSLPKFNELQRDILSTLGVLCYLTNTTPGIVMEENIAKLRARYPEKFDTNLSVNKNESNE
jgi:NTP pyrophosphatase (non-canonical NTP hydrolase)